MRGVSQVITAKGGGLLRTREQEMLRQGGKESDQTAALAGGIKRV